MSEITELIKKYEQQVPVKELAKQFGIHRLTVTALLRRHGVELRRVGLAQEDIQTAASLYDQGWSLARLGQRFRVDPATVWRALRDAGISMQPPRTRG
jgi:transposase